MIEMAFHFIYFRWMKFKLWQNYLIRIVSSDDVNRIQKKSDVGVRIKITHNVFALTSPRVSVIVVVENANLS